MTRRKGRDLVRLIRRARAIREAATGAILVANKIFWALGYWQVENYLVSRSSRSARDRESATVVPPSGKQPADADERHRGRAAARRTAPPTAAYRAIAARALPGRPLGGFRYYGTRPDDPNDIVPHEHRRELRALKVFGAWTNLVDMKAGNTLDSLVTERRAQHRAPLPAGRRLDVRHRRQRAARVRRRVGAPVRRRARSGSACTRSASSCSRGRRSTYEENPAIGRFEGAYSTPPSGSRACRPPRSCAPAHDDTFWAARRVMAFLRRHDPRDRQDREVYRSKRREAARRRPDPAPRQDRRMRI